MSLISNAGLDPQLHINSLHTEPESQLYSLGRRFDQAGETNCLFVQGRRGKEKKKALFFIDVDEF